MTTPVVTITGDPYVGIQRREEQTIQRVDTSRLDQLEVPNINEGASMDGSLVINSDSVEIQGLTLGSDRFPKGEANITLQFADADGDGINDGDTTFSYSRNYNPDTAVTDTGTLTVAAPGEVGTALILTDTLGEQAGDLRPSRPETESGGTIIAAGNVTDADGNTFVTLAADNLLNFGGGNIKSFDADGNEIGDLNAAEFRDTAGAFSTLPTGVDGQVFLITSNGDGTATTQVVEGDPAERSALAVRTPVTNEVIVKLDEFLPTMSEVIEVSQEVRDINRTYEQGRTVSRIENFGDEDVEIGVWYHGINPAFKQGDPTNITFDNRDIGGINPGNVDLPTVEGTEDDWF